MKFLKQATYIGYVIAKLSKSIQISMLTSLESFLQRILEIWLSQERKELSKWNKKYFPCFTVLSFRHKKQSGKNVADTTFKGCVRYIFASFFFECKREHLSSVFYFTSEALSVLDKIKF